MGSVTKDVGFGSVTGFKGHFQLPITIRCGSIANSHTLHFTRANSLNLLGLLSLHQ
jgi:hypothetical protein